MKPKLTTILLSLMFTTVAWAQNAVTIYQTDGKTANFAFAEKPVVTYTEDNLVLTTTKTSVQYPIYLIQKIEFQEEWFAPTDIKPTIEEADVKFSFQGGVITISGGVPNSEVFIYNIKGLKVRQYRLDEQGNTSISTTNLDKDIYIVKTKNISFKFRKL